MILKPAIQIKSQHLIAVQDDGKNILKFLRNLELEKNSWFSMVLKIIEIQNLIFLEIKTYGLRI